MKPRVFILLAALAVLAVPIPNAAARDLKAERLLFHRLQQLPAGAARPTLVVKLLKALVRSHPTLARKYYRVAITRIDSANGAPAVTATKLALLVLKFVKISGLSGSRIRKIESQIWRPIIIEPGIPTPTPEPTP